MGDAAHVLLPHEVALALGAGAEVQRDNDADGHVCNSTGAMASASAFAAGRSQGLAVVTPRHVGRVPLVHPTGNVQKLRVTANAVEKMRDSCVLSFTGCDMTGMLAWNN